MIPEIRKITATTSESRTKKTARRNLLAQRKLTGQQLLIEVFKYLNGITTASARGLLNLIMTLMTEQETMEQNVL